MRFRLHPKSSLSRGIRRVARTEADAALRVIRRSHPLSKSHVHALRKNLKRLRALMRLVEDPRRRRLRRASRALAPLRDVDVVRSTLKALMSDDARLMPEQSRVAIDQQLRRLHRDRVKHAMKDRTLDKVEKAVRKTAARVGKWRPAGRHFGALVPGLIQAHRRCRQALRRAASGGRDVDFHDWRKRLSVVRDHLLLLAPRGSRLHADATALDRAVTSLGDDHNLVVLRETLQRLAAERGPAIDLGHLQATLAARQRQLRRKALREASAICLRDSDDYVRSLEAAWKRSRR